MSDLDALTRMIAGLDTDVQILAQRQERTERLLASQEASRMESRLSPGSIVQAGTRAGEASTPSEIATGGSLVSRLRQDASLGSYGSGRIDPFFGRANVLRDPTLEQLVALTTGVASTPTSIGRWWEATATFTGAGSPFCDIAAAVSDRITGVARGSSSPLSVQFGWGVTGSPVSLEATVLPNTTMVVNEAPWLVAAVRARWDADSIVAEGLTGTVRLVILDNTDTEIASSDEAPLEAGEGFVEALLQCAYASPTDGDDYRPMAVISVAATSIGGVTTDAVTLTDWQFHESDTEDPPSFTPSIGSWIPNAVSTFGDPASPFIEGSDSTTGEIRFEVYPTGKMVWYDSAGAVLVTQDVAGDSGGNGSFSVTLAADNDCNDGSTPEDWLEFPVLDGRSYGLHVSGGYNVAHTSQALQVGHLHGGGRVIGVWQTFGNGAAGTAYTDAVDSTSTSSVLTANASTDATGYRAFRFDGVFICTANGTFRFRFRRGGANTTSPGVTIRKGSSVWVAASAV